MNIIQSIDAFESSASNFSSRFEGMSKKVENTFQKPQSSFINILEESLGNVNTLQTQKDEAVEAFASGQNNNVQDLMVAMQRASTAVQLTSAVRNKVLEIYREISRLSF